MKTDKNTVIGFVLLGILFFVFFWYTQKQQQAYLAEKQRTEDSLKKLEPAPVVTHNDTGKVNQSIFDSTTGTERPSGIFKGYANQPEQIIKVENDVMVASFSTKGGTLKSVELKHYKSESGNHVILGGDKAGIYYSVNTGEGKTAVTGDLNFSPAQSKAADGSQIIKFSLSGAEGKSIVHEYHIKKNDYLINWQIHLSEAQSLITNSQINFNWHSFLHQHQKDFNYEKQQSRIAYVVNGDYDYNSAYSGAEHTIEKPVQWFSFKQQFFNTTFISKSNFSSGKFGLIPQADTTNELFAAQADVQVKVPASSQVNEQFQLYFGPTDYKILSAYNNKMENLVDLGSGVFSFVKYINRYIIFPVFNFFAGFVKGYGWVILLLTLFIRLVTAPLTYKSYLSGAKMKVLRPELDALRKKHGDDQQAYAMDQMKLYREAGVNPLGGCIPAVLQIPIFFALYSFFNSNIDLRGVPFLWSGDLSQYDSIAHLPFSIPFGYGDHVSLFTLTAAITSFLISFYNMSMTPDTGNPAMKYIPYFFPFILLFIFNKLPSALTWYYTVSNIITLLLQFVIQNYIINHEKILAKIEETRKKPKVKSKWAQRYEEMMESQKKMQELKNKSQKK